MYKRQAPVEYTFTASNGVDPDQTVGPQAESSATLDLTVGTWTISVLVEDACSDTAGTDTCTQDIVVVSVGGAMKPMDMNGDGNGDLSDAVALLNHLFLGSAGPPCAEGGVTDAANVALLDSNGDGGIDLSDAVSWLNFLFLGGGVPSMCADPACGDCIQIIGCPNVCQ